MKKLLFILLICILISGCAEKERKFENENDSSKSIIFYNDEKQTAIYQSGERENYKGTWIETDQSITFFLDDDNGGNIIFKKLEDGKLGMILNDEGKISIYKKV